jgi:hypothetical protein
MTRLEIHCENRAYCTSIYLLLFGKAVLHGIQRERVRSIETE